MSKLHTTCFACECQAEWRKAAERLLEDFMDWCAGPSPGVRAQALHRVRRDVLASRARSLLKKGEADGNA